MNAFSDLLACKTGDERGVFRRGESLLQDRAKRSAVAPPEGRGVEPQTGEHFGTQDAV